MPVLVGFGVYALGSSIVHIAEGEGWRAAGSAEELDQQPVSQRAQRQPEREAVRPSSRMLKAQAADGTKKALRI